VYFENWVFPFSLNPVMSEYEWQVYDSECNCLSPNILAFIECHSTLSDPLSSCITQRVSLTIHTIRPAFLVIFGKWLIVTISRRSFPQKFKYHVSKTIKGTKNGTTYNLKSATKWDPFLFHILPLETKSGNYDF
jgi:hypothetical protein